MKAQVRKTAFRTGFTRHDVARPGRGEAVSRFDHSLSRRSLGVGGSHAAIRFLVLDFGFRVFSRRSVLLLALPLLLPLLVLPLGAQTPTPTPPPTVSIS